VLLSQVIIPFFARKHRFVFTTKRLNDKNIQELEQSLQSQFENHFQADEISQLAREEKFVQRKSKLDGITFLSLIVFNNSALRHESLNDLTIDLAQYYNVDITKQGLQERFNEYAVSFLTAALENLLNKQFFEKVSIPDCIEFKRFLIKDSVCFQVDSSLADYYPGSGGSASKANVRIQFEYDLLNGKIIDLSINAFNDQDAKDSIATLDFIKENDLIVRDLAYMHIDALQGIIDKTAHFLSRLNSTTKAYQKKNGELVELDFSAIIWFMRENKIKQVEQTVVLGENKDLQVRLFLFLMPTAVHNKRIRKAQKSAKKKGYQVSKAFKIRAALGLFITSAPVEFLKIDMAYKIYSLRWQIELTFKIWKSICKIDKVKKVKKERLECYILAKLLIIVLCWRIAWFTSRLLKQHYGKDMSFYKSFKTLMRDMYRLEKLFVSELIHAVDYLLEFLKLSSTKHLLEKKKGQSFSPEVFVSSLTFEDTLVLGAILDT
jgi:hypothetical protein